MAKPKSREYTKEELEKLRNECLLRFTYVPETGELVNTKHSRWVKAGAVAGCWKEKGYRVLSVFGSLHRVHRLIFLIHHGYLPQEIDHIDSDPSNNRIENLRVCTGSQNNANRRKDARNTSGFKGVSWDKERKKWIAGIKIGRKQRYLGGFDTKEEAHAAYCQKASELYGEFARPE